MTTSTMDEREAVALARRYFLDDRNVYGCAETTFIVLKTAFGLPDPTDAAPAMALNGGVAYGGGACGAITGAALAVGMLAERRIGDHREAKRVAREIVARLGDDIRAGFGAADCRALIGVDLRAPGAHEAFIASGLWRSRCMDLIEVAVGGLADLADEARWAAVVAELGSSREPPAP